MNVGTIFEALPMSETTLRKRMVAGTNPCDMANDGGHPCEYYLKDDAGEDFGMVKYYQGRKLACYTLAHP